MAQNRCLLLFRFCNFSFFPSQTPTENFQVFQFSKEKSLSRLLTLRHQIHLYCRDILELEVLDQGLQSLSFSFCGLHHHPTHPATPPEMHQVFPGFFCKSPFDAVKSDLLLQHCHLEHRYSRWWATIAFSQICVFVSVDIICCCTKTTCFSQVFTFFRVCLLMSTQSRCVLIDVFRCNSSRGIRILHWFCRITSSSSCFIPICPWKMHVLHGCTRFCVYVTMSIPPRLFSNHVFQCYSSRRFRICHWFYHGIISSHCFIDVCPWKLWVFHVFTSIHACSCVFINVHTVQLHCKNIF